MQELQLIDVKHRKIIQQPEKRPERCVRIETIAAASLAVNMLQAIVIYILQAGPI